MHANDGSAALRTPRPDGVARAIKAPAIGKNEVAVGIVDEGDFALRKEHEGDTVVAHFDGPFIECRAGGVTAPPGTFVAHNSTKTGVVLPKFNRPPTPIRQQVLTALAESRANGKRKRS